MFIIRFISILIIFFLGIIEVSAADPLSEITQKSKKGVVSIDTTVSFSPYDGTGRKGGTGFLIDKDKGYILTNRHVVGYSSIATYEVSFFNGQRADARLLYQDAWLDYAVLQVNPQDIPADVESLTFASTSLQNDQPVFIIGRNEGRDFSFQTGVVSNIYEIMGYLPQQSIRISLNMRGGGSGSPVFSTDGQVVGIIFASNNDSSAFALPISYVKDALPYLLKNQDVPRFHIGIIPYYYPIDLAVKYYGFPKQISQNYNKKFPQSFNRLLMIDNVLKGSPADGLIEPGDFIWALNGQEIGPDLYKMDTLLNNASKEITLDIYRRGELKQFKIPTYDMNKNKINRLVTFGGGYFFEPDDNIRFITGTPAKGVFVCNVLNGSTFFSRLPWFKDDKVGDITIVRISKIDGQPVQNLDDLIALIPSLIKKQNFSVTYRNCALYRGYNQFPIFNQNETVMGIPYLMNDPEPKIFEFDLKKQEWVGKEIKSVNETSR